jgi:hypothetical protein
MSCRPTSDLPCAETAHLANDCFRDLDGLGADDPYGDIWILAHGAVTARAGLSHSAAPSWR